MSLATSDLGPRIVQRASLKDQRMMLDENCLHFIYGETLYAIHKVAGQSYVTHFQRTTGTQEVIYLRIEFDGLPHEVKRAWREYMERTAS